MIALVENLLREDLDPIDEATAYQQLKVRWWSARKVAAKLHIHQSVVARRLSLLALPPDLQSAVITGDTRVKHAYDPADLARAFIREAFTGDDPEWWRSNNPNGAAAKHDAHTALGIPPAATPDSD